MIKYAAAIVIGGVIGAMMGSSRSCETGACPLTSNPYVGAGYGALLGFLLVSFAVGSSQQASMEEKAMTTAASSSVTAIQTQEQFQQDVLNASVPVLVDLWASWCGPCRSQMPIVEEVAEKAGDKAKVVKINVDDAGDIADKLSVNSIPTLVVFKQGKEVQRFVGVQSAATLSKALNIQ